MPFNVSSSVGKTLEAKYNLAQYTAQSFALPWNIENNRVFGTGSALFTFTDDAQGWSTSPSTQRNTLLGNPAPGFDISTSSTETPVRSTRGQTLSTLLGIPSNAFVTSLTVSYQRKITNFTLNASASTSLRFNYPSTVGTGENPFTIPPPFEYETFSRRTDFAPGQEKPANEPVILQLRVSSSTPPSAAPAPATVNFDNLSIEAVYYTLSVFSTLKAPFQGGGPVSSEFGLRWHNTNVAAKSLSSHFNLRNTVGDFFTTRYGILRQVTLTLQALWTYSIIPVSQGLLSDWKVRKVVGTAYTAKHNTQSLIGRNLAIRYNTTLPVGSTHVFRFNTTLPVTSYFNAIYSTTGPIGRALSSRWRLAEKTSNGIQFRFHKLTSIGRLLTTIYNATVPIARAFRLPYSGSAKVFAEYRIRYRSRSLNPWAQEAFTATIYTPLAGDTDIWAPDTKFAQFTLAPVAEDVDAWTPTDAPVHAPFNTEG